MRQPCLNPALRSASKRIGHAPILFPSARDRMADRKERDIRVDPRRGTALSLPCGKPHRDKAICTRHAIRARAWPPTEIVGMDSSKRLSPRHPEHVGRRRSDFKKSLKSQPAPPENTISDHSGLGRNMRGYNDRIFPPCPTTDKDVEHICEELGF